MEIDIRKEKTGDPSLIIFADAIDESTMDPDTANFITEVFGERLRIGSLYSDVELHYSDIDNLIKALKLAKKIWGPK